MPEPQPVHPVHIRILPWTDEVLDTLGFDPRSYYVESFWLPTLGPTGLLLLRHLADRFDASPRGFRIDAADTSARLGLGSRAGAKSPLRRSLSRLIAFDFAIQPDADTFLVRRNLPAVPRRHTSRLPTSLQSEFQRCTALDSRHPPHDGIRQRARSRAFVLCDLDRDDDFIQRTLTTLGFPPRVVAEATAWARRRHREIAAAIEPLPRSTGRSGVPNAASGSPPSAA